MKSKFRSFTFGATLLAIGITLMRGRKRSRPQVFRR